MTERLADLGARIEGIRQLGAVVNAMRGIAAARVQQSRNQLSAVDSYATAIAAGIERTLPILPAPRDAEAGPSRLPALVVFCAEQGFAGAFSERVLGEVSSEDRRAAILLVGTRGHALAVERGIKVSWNSPMPSHPLGVSQLANEISEGIYRRIAAGEVDRLDALYCRIRPRQGIRVERRRLFPLDLSAFPRSVSAATPLLNLTPETLMLDLIEEYMHAQLCAVALHSFAAENQSRMESMSAAGTQIGRRLSDLQSLERIVRQDEITAEIIELAAGESASNSMSGR